VSVCVVTQVKREFRRRQLPSWAVYVLGAVEGLAAVGLWQNVGGTLLLPFYAVRESTALRSPWFQVALKREKRKEEPLAWADGFQNCGNDSLFPQPP
jgi:hypothetical protein